MAVRRRLISKGTRINLNVAKVQNGWMSLKILKKSLFDLATNRRQYILPMILLCIPAMGYLAYVWAFGVNVTFWDEWSWVPLFRDYFQGHIAWALMWEQHNENRMFFPNLLALIVGIFTKYNSKVEMFMSAGLLIMTFLLILWFWLKAGLGLWRYVPMAFVIFSLVQNENSLWGFQTAWYLVLFFSAFSCLLLVKVGEKPQLVWYAIVLSFVGSFSSLQGLIIWPLGFVWLVRERQVMRRRPFRRLMTLWTISSVMVGLMYFYGLNLNAAGASSLGYFMAHPFLDVQYYLASLGGVMGLSEFTNVVFVSECIGVAILGIAAFVIVDYFRDSPDQKRSFFTMLVVFGMLFDLLLDIGRSELGVAQALSSRYTTYNLMLLVGLYGYLTATVVEGFSTGRSSDGWSKWSASVLGGLCAIVGLQVMIGTRSGLIQGQSTYGSRLATADVLVNYKGAPASLVTTEVYPAMSTFEDLAPVLHKYGLNTFSGPLDKRFENMGLVPSSYLTDGHSFLSIPLSVRSLVNATPQSRRGWKVLSAVYWATPNLSTTLLQREPDFYVNLMQEVLTLSTTTNGTGVYLYPYRNLYVDLSRQLSKNNAASDVSN